MSPDISSGDIETITYDLPINVQSLGKASQHDIQVHRTIYICISNDDIYIGRKFLHFCILNIPDGDSFIRVNMLY